MTTNYLEYDDGSDDLLKVESSMVEVDNFLLSTLHTDFQNEVSIRIEYLTNMLDDFNGRHTGRDYDMFRGGKRALLEMRNLFVDIKSGLIDKMEEARMEEKNED